MPMLLKGMLELNRFCDLDMVGDVDTRMSTSGSYIPL